MLITHSKFEAGTLLSFGWQPGDLPGHHISFEMFSE